MKILVVGGGGREHALVWKIKQSPLVTEVFCAPGNAGTEGLARNIPVSPTDIETLLGIALENQIGLTVIGPEQPLVEGMAERFEDQGLKVFGPTSKAAIIEGSKAFSKELMLQNNIPTAAYQAFTEAEPAREYCKGKNGLVVKADGLAAGKGVFVCNTEQEALDAVDQIMGEKTFGDAGSQVVIEEKLEGQEVSVLALSDGNNVVVLESAQDHKAVFDGDQGPNTGGMGAYSPAPVFTPEMQKQVEDTILKPTVKAMREQDRLYRGVLYAGLMITDEGPKVLEFNCRFGDPETQPLMMRLESDIVPAMQACAQGNLDEVSLQWKPEASVCVVMTAEGYPGAYEKGKPISGLEQAGLVDGVVVFHAGTGKPDKDIVTNGGRVLGVTAIGKDIQSAVTSAYQGVDCIHWDGVHFRKDIGHRAL